MTFASTGEINDFLTAIGRSNIIAVNLSDSGLKDIHLKGLTHIFLLSKRLMHIDIGLLNLELEAYDMLDKLIKTSPFIISMHISDYSHRKPLKYQNIKLPTTTFVSEES
jgi:hypothetical protein